TGTAKAPVSKDYANKLNQALTEVKGLIRELLQILLLKDGSGLPETFITLEDKPGGATEYPKIAPIELSGTEKMRVLVIANQVSFDRKQIIRFLVNTAYVGVLDAFGNEVEFQLSPVFNSPDEVSNGMYEVYLPIDVPAFGVRNYIAISTSSKP